MRETKHRNMVCVRTQGEGHLKFSGTKKEINMIFVVQFRKAYRNMNGMEEKTTFHSSQDLQDKKNYILKKKENKSSTTRHCKN